MTLWEFWMHQDWVVKTLITAFILATVIIAEKLYDLIRFSRALKALESSPLPLIQEVRDAIAAFRGKDKSLYDANVGVQVDKVDQALMRYIGVLGLIAILSPMLGLVGTFLGVWHVFEGVGSVGLNEPGVIARGIKEVLVDTMAGLIVAIYATIAYRFLELWVRRLSLRFEERLYRMIGSDDAA